MVDFDFCLAIICTLLSESISSLVGLFFRASRKHPTNLDLTPRYSELNIGIDYMLYQHELFHPVKDNKCFYSEY